MLLTPVVILWKTAMRIIGTVLMLGLLPSFAVWGEDTPVNVFASGSSIFMVRAQYPGGRVNYGSAILVQPGKFVTNCHVTRQAQRIVVVRGSAAWSVESQTPDIEHDLCILAVRDAVGEVPGFVKPGELKVGEKVYALGYGGFGHLTLSDGAVVALHPYDGAKVIQTSASFTFGESGGGLFDGRGRLVGIITFKTLAGGEYHFALPVEWVQALLARSGNKTAAIAPETGKAFWERPSEAQPKFMQAATLEAEKDWGALLKFAKGWIEVDATNAGAWIAKSEALHYLNYETEAASAFDEAVRLDPSYAQNEYPFEHTRHDLNERVTVQNLGASYSQSQ